MTSTYEQARLVNIARNHETLMKLGLAKTQNTNTLPVKRKKNQIAGPVRRSSRFVAAETQQEDVKVETVSKAQKDPQHVKLEMKLKVVYDAVPKSDGYSDLSFGTIQSQYWGSHDGTPTKNVDIRIDEMSNAWIGKVFLPPKGSGSFKEAAMNVISCEKPKFSKYSGVQVFNNAIVLFVNASPVSSSRLYENMFMHQADGVLEFSWFAQSRMTLEHAVVQQLLNPATKVFLMSRLPGQEYVCCGRLSLATFVSGTSPLKFIWRIDNTEILNQSQAFKDILEYSSKN